MTSSLTFKHACAHIVQSGMSFNYHMRRRGKWARRKETQKQTGLDVWFKTRKPPVYRHWEPNLYFKPDALTYAITKFRRKFPDYSLRLHNLILLNLAQSGDPKHFYLKWHKLHDTLRGCLEMWWQLTGLACLPCKHSTHACVSVCVSVCVRVGGQADVRLPEWIHLCIYVRICVSACSLDLGCTGLNKLLSNSD